MEKCHTCKKDLPDVEFEEGAAHYCLDCSKSVPVQCADCGKMVPAGEARYGELDAEDTWYCADCWPRSLCGSCHERPATGIRAVPWSADGANICDACAEPAELRAAAEAVEVGSPDFSAAEWCAENLTEEQEDSRISRERAQDILASLDRADEYDEAADYYIGHDREGDETLLQWGFETPLATNHGSTSWL